MKVVAGMPSYECGINTHVLGVVYSLPQLLKPLAPGPFGGEMLTFYAVDV